MEKIIADPTPVDDAIGIAEHSPVKRSLKRKYEELEEDENTSEVFQTLDQVKSDRVTRSRVKSTKRETASNTVTSTSIDPAEAHANKPEPHGQPLAWADKRAALNDALPYFKSHQGGVYSAGLMPKGMLIDGIVGTRDHFSSQVIVTSIGGGRVLDPVTKKMIRIEDQGDDGKNYKALMRAWEAKHPFVMVAGARNTMFPVKPPHSYNVLDYFHITDIWQEKTKEPQRQAVMIYMVRLEKVNLTNRSWWAPRDVSGPEAGEFGVGEYSCTSIVCTTCQNPSKEIFEQGWTCLNSQCGRFFEFATTLDFNELKYNNAFLRERSKYSGIPIENDLIPALPSDGENTFGSEKEYKQGILCPKCGCCSRRIKWDGWYCENAECDFTHTVPIKMTPLDRIKSENKNAKSKKNIPITHCDPCVEVHKTTIGGQKLKTFFLLNENGGHCIGTITRIRPTEEAISREGGLNDLYLHLQKEDLKLERRPAKNPGCRVEELTSHFSGNFGAPYKFGVVVKTTTSFEDAPTPILETLLRLTWGGKAAVEASGKLIRDKKINVLGDSIPSGFEAYNEQLVLGYFEKSKISAHDDGEKELGPNVASLSLGSPSVIKFSPKKGKDIGGNKDINKKRRGSVLSVKLKHGDMLVMHGEQIQKLYLHAVEPRGKHRFALTCRHIRPDTIPDEEQRILSITTGKVPDRWAAIRYNGEEDQFESRATGEVVACPGTVVGSTESPQNPAPSEYTNGAESDSVLTV
ncbi:hypothetical protein F4813DRAFT_398851 [Daldinia decipiens]|uniref:uncharacterized protein n=1 Tax=Daldinia decipiens TaxID=326647 RepID=UPI0020C58CC4|nr:uncharacterized protein F4813DRAFT_398851 [Daldinia decipiens]KAI1654716.1 hypothetical protein F4813DRAFT_398851 [Daldinia decipiens]